MHEYEQVLRGGVGLYVSSQGITQEEWRSYVSNLQINTYWPGIQGVGYSIMIPPARRDAFLAEMRKKERPDFDIRPSGAREIYSSIIYLEPLDWRNKRAIGYDMFSRAHSSSCHVTSTGYGLGGHFWQGETGSGNR